MAGLTAFATLTLAAPAPAQEEGVFIDPDSPSAKEYRIPLESERRQADPSQEPSSEIVQGARSSPIFGAGIVAKGAGSDRNRAQESGAATDGAEPSSAGKPAEADAAILKAATSNPGPPAGGVGMPLTVGGVAAGVLLLGGLAGLLLRRRRV
jgi:hypothetical protein